MVSAVSFNPPLPLDPAYGGTGVAGPSSAIGAVYILANSGTAVSCGADTTEDTLATITVPAGAMGTNGALRITTYWAYTNSADDKILRIRFSGASGTQYRTITNTTTTNAWDQIMIRNVNSASSQIGIAATETAFNLASANAFATSAVNTAVATTVVITGQKETGGDTLTLSAYTVELLYAA